MNTDKIISIKKLLKDSGDLRDSEFAGLEQKKTGVLRAGNSSLLTAEGEFIGQCPRMTYLRYKGINVEEFPADRKLMFDAGRMNEEIWTEKLKRVWPPSHIVREEETPTSWSTSNGVTVTGRPDLVLLEDGPEGPTAALGLELKMVSSLWTAREVFFQREPKLLHLIQAGHYMWQMNIPFKLCYTLYVDMAVTGWAGGVFPKKNQPLSEFCSYTPAGKISKILPFEVVYDLSFDRSGKLFYQLEGSEKEKTASLVTIDRIRDYYEFISQMDQKQRLPSPPKNLKPSGEKCSWKLCHYCSLSPVCSVFEAEKTQKYVENKPEYQEVSAWVSLVRGELKKRSMHSENKAG
ncbi:hypothetical protein PN36_35030 [Candidatus Thiomargarita nelsonii]|uniref:PD-(D/E)XK endonuclease-like domain-containing protein n=1 Tax=Candidatus Thiomargarita nelsonii TaxID=1003181 RepID=A0A4E0QPZ3_9GAMM|nr:hypothetical protein PN36_35030 [Candidatus Thiomargarita nelsonii]